MNYRVQMVVLVCCAYQMTGCSAVDFEVFGACQPIATTPDGQNIYDNAACEGAKAKREMCKRNPSLCKSTKPPKPKEQLQACREGDARSCGTYAEHLAEQGDDADLPLIREFRGKACKGNTSGWTDPASCRKYGQMLYHGTGGPVDRQTARQLLTDACEGFPFSECLVLVDMMRTGEAGPVELAEAIRRYSSHCDQAHWSACDSLVEIGQTRDALTEAEFFDIQESMCKRENGAACVYVLDNRPARITDDEEWSNQKLHHSSKACYNGYPDRCKFVWEAYGANGPNYLEFAYLEKACENSIIEACERLLAHPETYRQVQVVESSEAVWEKNRVRVWESHLQEAKAKQGGN